MEYSNPEIPEGINTTPVHPLKEFALLLLGVVGVTAVAVAVLVWSAQSLARYIPFAVEQRLAPPNVLAAGGAREPEITRYLQSVSERLAAAQRLPADMTITVHYVADDTVNAYATLGGHIVVFRGLIDTLPDENSLAMVLAHEVAHVKRRHPIMALSRGVIIGLVLSVVTGGGDADALGEVLGQTGLLTVLSFSRDQEREADRDALAAVAAVYGHVAGADRMFERLSSATADRYRPPAFFSSHPGSPDRTDDLRRLAAAQGWPATGSVTAIPEAIRRALRADGSARSPGDTDEGGG